MIPALPDVTRRRNSIRLSAITRPVHQSPQLIQHVGVLSFTFNRPPPLFGQQCTICLAMSDRIKETRNNGQNADELSISDHRYYPAEWKGTAERKEGNFKKRGMCVMRSRWRPQQTHWEIHGRKRRRRWREDDVGFLLSIRQLHLFF